MEKCFSERLGRKLDRNYSHILLRSCGVEEEKEINSARKGEGNMSIDKIISVIGVFSSRFSS